MVTLDLDDWKHLSLVTAHFNYITEAERNSKSLFITGGRGINHLVAQTLLFTYGEPTSKEESWPAQGPEMSQWQVWQWELG